MSKVARILVLGGLVVGAAAVPAAVVPAGAAAASTNLIRAGSQARSPLERSATTQTSLNWSGYIRSGSGFTSTTATFTVPKLLTTYNGYSSMWVGIDGASNSDNYLIQTGIEADVVNNQASYYAWWELITPTDQAPEEKFTKLTVKPGNSVTATVAKTTGGDWTMTLRNNTTKAVGTHTARFAGKGESAEWIVEDTDVNGSVSTAPDWQSVTMSSIALNHANPDLKSSEAVNIQTSAGLLGILGARGIQETATAAPNSAKNGFTVKWLATGTPSPIGS